MFGGRGLRVKGPFVCLLVGFELGNVGACPQSKIEGSKIAGSKIKLIKSPLPCS